MVKRSRAVTACLWIAYKFLDKRPRRDASRWVLDSTCEVLCLSAPFRIAIPARITECFRGSTLIKNVHENISRDSQ